MLRWYLLTNLGDLKQSIDTFKCRSGIEALFKDCNTSGYNEREEPRSELAFKQFDITDSIC